MTPKCYAMLACVIITTVAITRLYLWGSREIRRRR